MGRRDRRQGNTRAILPGRGRFWICPSRTDSDAWRQSPMTRFRPVLRPCARWFKNTFRPSGGQIEESFYVIEFTEDSYDTQRLKRLSPKEQSVITKHAEEIEGFLAGNAPAKLMATDELVEDRFVFALEKHLEDFLVQNWTSTELGQNSCNVSSRTKRFVVPSVVGKGEFLLPSPIRWWRRTRELEFPVGPGRGRPTRRGSRPRLRSV